MTETHDLRNQWYDEPVQYETPMTELEEVKAQIKALQSKLSFLEELEQTKSRKEKDYKKVYGEYPNYNNPSRWEMDSWDGFHRGYDMGYNAAQEDYKVGECQEPAKDVVSLYKRFKNEGTYGQIYFDDALTVTREFLMDEGVIEYEDEEYVTFKLQKSLLEIPND